MTPDEVREPEDLSALDKEGLVAFLNSEREDKVELWNAWREATGWEPVDLEAANLVGAWLEGINLREARLERADLSEARLAEADLSGADLLLAKMRGTNFSEANLTQVRLSGTDLNGASLCGAIFSGVNLSSVWDLRGVKFHPAYLWGVLRLRHRQLVAGYYPDTEVRGWRRLRMSLANRLYESTIWEETEGLFSQASEVFKSLKGYFEDAGDYEGANWAYVREKVMAKLMRTPRWMRWSYFHWSGKWDESFCRPALFKWASLEFAEKVANYGTNLLLPLFWLGVVIFGCAVIYSLTGSVTAMPGCGYAELRVIFREGCAPTRNVFDNLLFSLSAMTSEEVGRVQMYREWVGFLMTAETLIGIGLTGLVGYVLGNRLRYS